MYTSTNVFQSTLPIQGETVPGRSTFSPLWSFQSTLPIQGETLTRRIGTPYMNHFNPLSLYRERPCVIWNHLLCFLFQSTLPIQGETFCKNYSPQVLKAFQSTLPIQGETPMVAKALFEYGVFQSTLPIQGETLLAACEIYGGIFQSTLPIQGETELADYIEAKRKISIHSPYTGRDSNHHAWLAP